MGLFDKLRRRMTQPAQTAGYVHHGRTPFQQVRDLPPFSFHTIESMLLDPTIRLGLAMRMGPLCQAEFAFQNSDESWTPGVRADRPEVGQFVFKQLQRLWRFDLHKLLRAQVWGWSAGEVMYKLKDGKVTFDRLLDRHAMDTFAITKGGDIAGVEVRRIKAIGTVPLMLPKAFWHAYEPQHGSPYGHSVLKGAYSPWADKNLNGGGAEVRRLFMYKDAYGGVDTTYPPGTTNIDGTGEVPNRDIMRQLAEQITAGGVTARPAVFDPVSGKPLFDITRATVPSNPVHILQYPKDLDVEELRGMEIPDDVITSEATGAWQGKQVPMLAFFTSLDRWLAQLVRTVVIQIMEPLVLINEGRAEAFEVTTKPLAEQAMEQMKSTLETNRVRPVNGRRQPEVTVEPQRRFSLHSDSNTAELLVGQGVVEASHLVAAGRDYLAAHSNGN